MKDFILKDYQVEDIANMNRLKRVYNANVPGAGKTLECLCFVEAQQCKKALVICPRAAKGVWAYEVKKWYGWTSTVLNGTPKQRAEQLAAWDTMFLIINIQQLDEVLRSYPKWEVVIIDEIHALGLLNHKSKAFKTVAKIDCDYFVPMTGTPVRKTPADLFAPLHLIDRKMFPSYWKFVNKWCLVHDGPFGKEIMNQPKNPLALNEMLKNYMVRQPIEVIQAQLPTKIRRVLPCTMSKRQEKAYRELLDEMILECDNGDLIITSGALAQCLRLRQLLIAPELVGISADGGALEDLTLDLIPADFSDGHSVAICTPFRAAIPFIKAAIERNMPDVELIEEIHGKIKVPAAEVAERYQNHPGTKKILIYTTSSGFSWTAHAASRLYCLGSSYSYVQQLQAENRIYRVGQTKHTIISYMSYPGTIDDSIISVLEDKNSAAEWTLQPEDVLRAVHAQRDQYLKNK